MTVPIAFLAGVAAFFSPCVLPLVPTWLAFLGGGKGGRSLKFAFNLILFMLGFGLIFTLLGAGASNLGQFLLSWQGWLSRVAGLVLMVFGLQMAGVFNLPFLSRGLQFNFSPAKTPLGYFLFGVILGVGYSPCIGIMLASILILAGALDTVAQGMLLLFVFSAGFALPFLLIGFVLGPEPLRKLPPGIAVLIHKVAGVVLTLMGLLLVLDRWHWLQSLFLGW
jgi:cytochrome c-type biogenesis protein